jgi:hypothetical protein
LLSYICRAEDTHHVAEFEDQIQLSFDKEFHATTIMATPQILNYDALLSTNHWSHLHPQAEDVIPMSLSLTSAYRAKILRLKNLMFTLLLLIEKDCPYWSNLFVTIDDTDPYDYEVFTRLTSMYDSFSSD